MSIMSSMLWPAREDWRIQLRMADVAEVCLLMAPIVRASRRRAISWFIHRTGTQVGLASSTRHGGGAGGAGCRGAACGPTRPSRMYDGLAWHGLHRQQRDDQQCHDVDDLDHRIDCRAGGVLVRVTHGVAGHGGLVRLGVLAAEVAVLD